MTDGLSQRLEELRDDATEELDTASEDELHGAADFWRGYLCAIVDVKNELEEQ